MKRFISSLSLPVRSKEATEITQEVYNSVSFLLLGFLLLGGKLSVIPTGMKVMETIGSIPLHSVKS